MANVSPPNLKRTVSIEGSSSPNITLECEFGILATEKETGFFKRTLFKFVEERITKIFVFDLSNGLMNQTAIYRLAPFEIVNTHQWEGHEPMKILSKDGRTVIDTQPAMWDIASANQATGERILAIRTNSKRDDVFKIATRMNMVADYARTLLSPFRPTLDAGDVIPASEIVEAVKDQPPDFGW